MASWALRSLAAATIFMALVICRVLFTERMRFRMSRREAMAVQERSAFQGGSGRRGIYGGPPGKVNLRLGRPKGAVMRGIFFFTFALAALGCRNEKLRPALPPDVRVDTYAQQSAS